MPGSPNPPPANAPLPYAPTVATSGGAPQNKATILGAPAPQLAALLKQPPGGAANPGANPGGNPAAVTPGGPPAPKSQFCGRCGSQTQYVAQYQRYFCQKCQQYT
jgi:hypothetical protein